MSAQNTLSRREALSLFGAATGSVVAATLTARTAAAQSRDVIGAATLGAPAVHLWLRVVDRPPVAHSHHAQVTLSAPGQIVSRQ